MSMSKEEKHQKQMQSMQRALNQAITENKFLRNIWLWSKKYHYDGDSTVLMKLSKAIEDFDAYNSAKGVKPLPETGKADQEQDKETK